jgi:hypothetical protein
MNFASTTLEPSADMTKGMLRTTVEAEELREIFPSNTTLPLPSSGVENTLAPLALVLLTPTSFLLSHHGELCGGSRAFHPADDGS